MTRFVEVDELPTRTIQCSHVIERCYYSLEWRGKVAKENAFEVKRCLTFAAFEVAGKPLCHRHAGTALLQIAVSLSRTQKVQRAWDSVETLPSINFADSEAAALHDAINRNPVKGGSA